MTGCRFFLLCKNHTSSFSQFKMSAKHYFPDSFSCDGHRSSQSGRPHQPLASAPSVAADGAGGAAGGGDDGGDDIREGGGSDAWGEGVPFSPFCSHDSYTFAYNSALQNDL